MVWLKSAKANGALAGAFAVFVVSAGCATASAASVVFSGFTVKSVAAGAIADAAPAPGVADPAEPDTEVAALLGASGGLESAFGVLEPGW